MTRIQRLRSSLLALFALLFLAATPPAQASIDAPCNPNSLPEVSQLMGFMDSISGQYILSGQYELPDWFGESQEQEFDFLKTNTGKLPAIRGFDFMFYSLSSNRMQRVSERAIQWHKRGGIVTIAFHMNVPGVGGDAFYVKSAAGGGAYTNFDLNQAVIDGTPENAILLERLDIAAEELKKLRDARVPVLWRPFHECSGGWFWWGAKGATAYKALWHLMYDRYTRIHGLNNLIWIYNPTGNGATDTDTTMRAWYPGDAECDMISLDFYPSSHQNFAAEYGKINAFKGGHKLIGMSENGAIPDPDTMFTQGANWTWFGTWYRDFITDGLKNSLAFVQKVYTHAKVLTLDELPALYGTSPVFTIHPVGGAANSGDKVTLSAYALGSGDLAFQWKKDGVALSGATQATYEFASVAPADAGSYTVTVSNHGGTVESHAAVLSVSNVAGAAISAPKLINLSTRAQVGTGANVLIAGFSITGAGSKKVLIRGVGPTLVAFGINTFLADPMMTLYTSNNTPVVSNNDWELDDKATITNATNQLTIWGLKAHATQGDNAYDSAIVATLPAGNYTAIIKGVANGTGVAIVEVYDLDKGSAARLGNLSARGFVGTGADQMIAGFVTEGSGSKRFLIRAIGPTLAAFSIPGFVANPYMELVDNIAKTTVASNDDWSSLGADTVKAVDSSSGAFDLYDNSLDSVLIESVGQGNFTANVTGVANTSGTALLEIYEAP